MDKENNQKEKLTYSQHWSSYNKAQVMEKTLFMKMLADLCSGINNNPYTFGRPKLSLADMVFCSAFKVYSLYSGRRFSSDIMAAKENRYITATPHYNSIFNYLQKEDLTSVLMGLIVKSSLPLKTIETEFAIDASGFSTSRFHKWFDEKWGKGGTHKVWIKAHIVCGVKTNIVTAVRISESTAHDSPFLKDLVTEAAKNFNVKELSADKAYLSCGNLETIDDIGAIPFIPFKKNSTEKPSYCSVWNKMYHYFMLNQEEFMKHYHKRSNVETTFHMIKSKFGDSVKSRKKTAQVNEILCKILCHNICVVIQEMFELGIVPDFEGYKNKEQNGDMYA